MDNQKVIKRVKAGENSTLEIKKSGQTIIRIGKNGKARAICRVTGAKNFSHDLRIELIGQGAECRVAALFHGRAKDRHIFNVTLHHQASQTKGDVSVKAVYENESRGIFSGLITIAENGQKTDSFLRNDVLLLDKAMAVSKPTLEIANDDVKASHGSTTTTIDANHLFYLQSRGLSPIQAKQLIIEGFLKPAASWWLTDK
jgi:Fe-S cluster assembly protein SufD